ncbi:MAG: hypothetical protein P4L71_15530 [Acetobacteraceae bacterium]|nr:hypothetical protein [Acetobacteraceae bacterium]
MTLGSAAAAQDCNPSQGRSAEGDWSGTYQKSISLRGAAANGLVDVRFHGAIRFHVDRNSNVDSLAGDLSVDVLHSAQGDGSSESGMSSATTELDLAAPSTSQSFRAVGTAPIAIRFTVDGTDGAGSFTQNIAGRMQLDFRLLTSACDTVSGTVESPQFQSIRNTAPKDHMEVASDPVGRWTVSHPAASGKVK